MLQLAKRGNFFDSFIFRFYFSKQNLCKIQKRQITREKSQSRQTYKTGKDDMSMIRNIGILAHIDAGKTTTTERMLFYSGFSNHLGEVDHGDTVMDYMAQERERGITITSAAISLDWKKHKINLIDTPGHVDFTVEVERCLRVLDGAVVVLDSSAGVEAQTQTVWRQADRYSIPRIVYLNKMDKRGATVEKCLQSLKDKFHVEPLLLQHPIGFEKDFEGMIDLVTLDKLVWNRQMSADGNKFSVTKVSETDKFVNNDEILKARSTMIGQLSEYDENIAEAILSDVKIENIPMHIIFKAIRTATINRKLIPVLCGSSLKNKGVQPLLDAVANYLPSPLDMNYTFSDFYGSDMCALAFKIIHDRQRGPLTFIRLYSGALKSGSTIYNINKDCSEKTSRLLHVYANEFHETTMASAGNIICVSGLKETITGDTLTNSKSTALSAMKEYKKKKLDEEDNDNVTGSVLAGVQIPAPVFFCAIEPPSLSSQKQFDFALECLQREDPSLTVEVNEDTGQTILSGMGELHLDIIKQRLYNEYKLDVQFGDLQIAYRETISEQVTEEETLDKKIGDKHHQVLLKLSLEPDSTCGKFKHVELSPSREHPLDHIKRQHIVSIENGINSALSCGILLNVPVINVKVSLYNFHIGQGTSLAMISACASQCIHRLLKEAGPVLLEPMMSLSITIDGDRLHSVLGDLSQRRSHIQNVEATNGEKVVEAVTPLSELMGYSTTLRTITSGTASFSMELSHYEAMSLHHQNIAIKQQTGFMPS